VNVSESLLMPRQANALWREVAQGGRDRPLRGGRRRLRMLLDREDTAVPGVERTPGPSRISGVWNMETSPGSGPCKNGGLAGRS